MNPAAGVVRRWVALYTRGLPADLRDQRRAEIESDVWSQSEEAEALGRTPISVDMEMLVRLALGIPADVGWRHSHRRGSAASNRKEIDMHASRFRQALTYIGAAWAALGLAFAVMLLVDIQSHHEDRPGDVVVASAAAVAILLGTGLALVGLLRIGQDPATGRQMTLVGAVVAGGTAMFLLSWMWVIGIILALPLVIIAVVRARQVTEAGPQQSA